MNTFLGVIGMASVILAASGDSLPWPAQLGVAIPACVALWWYARKESARADRCERKLEELHVRMEEKVVPTVQAATQALLAAQGYTATQSAGVMAELEKLVREIKTP